MKSLYKILAALTALSGTTYAVPIVTLEPAVNFFEVGQTFKLDVVVKYNALIETGEAAELSGFGFKFSTSSNLFLDHVVLNPHYDNLSFFSDEIVAFAGLAGGSTDSTVTLASFFFVPQHAGIETISLVGDRFDDSGVMGLYYTTLGNLNDPLDDRYFAFDVAGDLRLSISAATAVPEPATTGMAAAGALMLLVVMRRTRRKKAQA